MSWTSEFDLPITAPNGASLLTLRDAAAYVRRLSTEIHDRPEWQLAIATLIDAAEGRDFVMHARIAMLRALNHGQPQMLVPRRKPVRRYNIR